MLPVEMGVRLSAERSNAPTSMSTPDVTPSPEQPANAGCGAVACSPSLDCSREQLVEFIQSMKGGERVIEMGQSGMKGETGTVEIRESGVCIRWDTKFDQPGTMVTSFTGGARLLSQANK